METVLPFLRDNWWRILFYVAIALTLYVGVRVLQRVAMRSFLLRKSLYSDVDIKLERITDAIKERPEQKKLTDAIEAKKEKLLNLPNISFHYADKERIRDFYNDYFKEPTVESLVRELVTEATADVTGGVPKVIEAKLGGKDLSKWISTLKLPDKPR